jgi:hypothetical protein
MIYHATNLLDAAATLQPASLEALFHRLRDDADLREDTARLRRVRQLDQSAYTRLKTRMPFFCCGRFRQGIRRSEHFEQIEAWVLDVDHYSGDESAMIALAARLQADDRVALLFRSPGGDGIKLLFRLNTPCTDTKQFSDAYKAFAFSFGEQYGLGKHIDFRTSDVTRVCFLAHDPFACMNPMAELVDWQAMLPEQTQPVLADLFGTRLAAQAQQGAEEPQKPGRSHAIHPDTYADILRKLQTKARPNPLTRQVFVPQAVALALPVVQAALETHGIAVAEVRDIQYGKQLALRCGVDTAACNLFYGKRGFSVVQVLRRNANEHLGQLVVHIAEQAIFSQSDWYGHTPSDTDNSLPGGAADHADVPF